MTFRDNITTYSTIHPLLHSHIPFTPQLDNKTLQKRDIKPIITYSRTSELSEELLNIKSEGISSISLIVDSKRFFYPNGHEGNKIELPNSIKQRFDQALTYNDTIIESLIEEFYLSGTIETQTNKFEIKPLNPFIKLIHSISYSNLTSTLEKKPKFKIDNYELSPRTENWGHKIDSAIKGRVHKIMQISKVFPVLYQTNNFRPPLSSEDDLSNFIETVAEKELLLGRSDYEFTEYI